MASSRLWRYIYDQVYTFSFHQKLESILHNAATATTGAVRGISRKKRYHKLSFKAPEIKRWYGKRQTSLLL